jgi:hypothetical protein
MDFVDYCPPAIVARIRAADLRSDENSDLFSYIASGSTLDCQIYALKAVA